MTDTLPEQTTRSSADLRLEMKCFVLQALLDKASAVLPSKDVLPVLKNFQIELSDDRIRVVATDLELSVIATTEMVAIRRPGMAVFPGRKMVEILKEAAEGDLILDVSKGKATIAIGTARWALQLMDETEYPPIPDLEGVEFHPYSRSEFLHALQSVRYAAATDAVRSNLMMVNILDGRVRASDGVRFQQVLLPNFPLNIEIPIGAVEDILKLLRVTDSGNIMFGETEEQLVFRIGGDAFLANKLVADYPDMDAELLRPAMMNLNEFNVDRLDLMNAVKRVRITADPETNAILLELGAGDRLSIKSRDKFGNTAEDEVLCKWSGGSHIIAVNHQHFMDMLSMADVKSCSFFLGEDTPTRRQPVMLRDEESGMVGIVNQMRPDWVS